VGYVPLGGKENGRVGWTDLLKQYNKALGTYTCPSDDHTFSYSRNTYEGGYPESGQPSYAVSDIQDPTKFMDFFECPGAGHLAAQFGGNNTAATGDADLDNAGQTDGNVYGSGGNKMSKVPSSAVGEGGSQQGNYHWLYWPGRHNNGNNLLFLDNHVKFFNDWDKNQMTFDPQRNWGNFK
jgi:prepilin-type processing-associated H-X9-DG protein